MDTRFLRTRDLRPNRHSGERHCCSQLPFGTVRLRRPSPCHSRCYWASTRRLPDYNSNADADLPVARTAEPCSLPGDRSDIASNADGIPPAASQPVTPCFCGGWDQRVTTLLLAKDAAGMVAAKAVSAGAVDSTGHQKPSSRFPTTCRLSSSKCRAPRARIILDRGLSRTLAVCHATDAGFREQRVPASFPRLADHFLSLATKAEPPIPVHQLRLRQIAAVSLFDFKE